MTLIVPLQKVWFFLLMVALHQGAFGPVFDFSGVPRAHAESLAVGASDHGGGNLLQDVARIAPPGWNLSEPARRFVPKNIWELINGRAEFFLAYGMVEMVFAQYRQSSAPGSTIDVSIYAMGTPANAFGVFAGERQEDISPVELGRQGYRLGPHLFIWKGAYYVRMIASDDRPGLLRTNLQIAKKLMPLLHDPGEPLWGLQTLPGEDRVPGSEQYFLRDALGLDFLTDTYTAQYRKKDVLVTAFLLRRENPASAREILRRYAAYAKQFGEDTREVTRQGVVILLCDMDGSYDALFQKEDMVGGVTSIEDPGLALDFAYDLWQRLPAPARDKQK